MVTIAYASYGSPHDCIIGLYSCTVQLKKNLSVLLCSGG